MAICAHCGAALRDGAAFCGGCGAKVEAAAATGETFACGSCGRTLTAGTRFCGYCGASADAPGEAPVAPEAVDEAAPDAAADDVAAGRSEPSFDAADAPADAADEPADPMSDAVAEPLDLVGEPSHDLAETVPPDAEGRPPAMSAGAAQSDSAGGVALSSQDDRVVAALERIADELAGLSALLQGVAPVQTDERAAEPDIVS